MKREDQRTPDGFAETFGRTRRLLNKARGGESNARKALLENVLPAFRRIASGFVPEAIERRSRESIISEAVRRVLSSYESVDASTRAELVLCLRRELIAIVGSGGSDALSGRSVPANSSTDRDSLRRYMTFTTRLPHDEQVALILFAEAGLGFEEIGRLAEWSPSDARTKLTAALERLGTQRADTAEPNDDGQL